MFAKFLHILDINTLYPNTINKKTTPAAAEAFIRRVITMYSNENNSDRRSYEYHYSYRPDGGEPVPTLEPVSSRKPKTGLGKRIVAGVLCGALLLGSSFGVGWLVRDRFNSGGETQLYLSDRQLPEVKTVNVNGKDRLTYPQIYQANVDSSVSINVISISQGYNFFGRQVQTASSGSGFIISKDGYIVTNYHVVGGGSSVEVTLNNGKTYPAQIIGGDPDYDIAVIKVDPGEDELQPVVLGTSSSLQVGDEVVAIGNPLGELTFSMSEGIVSCLNREITVDNTPFNMIQVTAAVNSGNSGGPLFNIYGEVVGIVSAKYSSGGASSSSASVEGLGFAIPIDDVLSMIKDIIENGQVTSKAYMGVTVADAVYYPETGVRSGAYLAEVVENGPAARAGLQAGDVITMIGTTTITSQADVTSAMGSKSYRAGDTTTVTFVRDGQVMTAELTFGSTTEKPQEDQTPQPAPSSQQDNYGNMDDFLKEFFGSSFDG